MWIFGFQRGEGDTVRSVDGGMTWRQVHLPSEPRARMLALWEDGTLDVDGPDRGPQTVRVEDYVDGPPLDVSR